jgi:hypothetical protein
MAIGQRGERRAGRRIFERPEYVVYSDENEIIG